MFKKMVGRFLKEESGQGMVEYAILVALLVVATILVIRGMGDSIKGKFTEITNELKK